MRSTWGRALTAAAAVLAVAAGMVVATGAVTQAAPVTDFDPGYIISDAIFYDAGTMSADGVTAFIAEKGALCNATGDRICLKNYRESTPTRTADAYCTGTYQGAAGETAAQIISKVATACGVNPQVLLVTLQKEQGLVTATSGQLSSSYAKALGFGCPDGGAPCDPQYAGFANQVYSAARQFKRYAANPGSYSYRAGRLNTIAYSPTSTCGSSQVYIENQATAGLYIYTPYQPNAAALAAGTGTAIGPDGRPDPCASYGNRNFHNYFTQWFGSAVQRTAIGTIDAVVDAGNGKARVYGWAFDPDVQTGIGLHVYVDGVATAAFSATGARPDVFAVYRHGAVSGYDATFTTGAGRHSVCLYGIDANGGTNVLLGCRDVTVSNRTDLGVIDFARGVGPDRIEVGGWAFDPDGPAPVGVHVYVDGIATFATSASGSRPDVQAIYGNGAISGYYANFPATQGQHQVCVYGLDTNGGVNVLLGCRTASVANRTPLGVIDVAQGVAGSQIWVAGWAFDPDTTGAIAVHVYVDGVATLATSASGSRPDVQAIYGNGAVSGYGAVFGASPGQHEVCVYGIDANGGTNVLLGCRTTTVA